MVDIAHTYWVKGDYDAFIRTVSQNKLELWQSDLIFQWITEGPITHGLRAQTYPNVTAHYELMFRLIQGSIDSLQSFWWDDDQMQKWIYALVEHRYPWFVCNSWSHTQQDAISHLHYSSLCNYHTSNLHKLMHHQLIDHLWDAPDFMESMVDQFSFFKKQPSCRRSSWRKEMRKQLQYYPYDNDEYVLNTAEALLLAQNTSFFKYFMTEPGSEHIWTIDVLQLCIKYEQIDLVEWMLDQGRIQMNVSDWYDCTVLVHPYHMNGSLSSDFRSPRKHSMLKLLLTQFDVYMEPMDWFTLFTFVHDNHAFANLLVMTYRGEALLDYAWTKVIMIIDTLRQTNEEMMIDYNGTEYSIDIQQPNNTIFYELEELTQNSGRWTFFANALRWGSLAVVKWLHGHGSRFHVECYTHHLFHNTLSLSCYNSSSKILEWIIQEANPSEFHIWIETGMNDVVRALLRRTLPPKFSTERLTMILNNHTLSSKFKSNFVTAVAYELVLISKQITNTNCEKIKCIEFDATVPRVKYHPILEFALNLTGKFNAIGFSVLLANLSNVVSYPNKEFGQETITFETIVTDLYHRHGAYKWVESYIHLVTDLEETQTDKRLQKLMNIRSLESVPWFRKEMRFVFCSQTRCRVVYAWMKQPNFIFSRFLESAKNEWNWYVRHDLTTQYFIRQRLSSKELYTLYVCGQYPFIIQTTQHKKQAIAKAFRLLRTCARNRFRRIRSSTIYQQKRVLWELTCFPSTTTKTVLSKGSSNYRQLENMVFM